MGQVSCATSLNGAGDSCVNVLPLTDMRVMLLLRPGFTFADSESMSLAEINAAIANKDVIVVPYVRDSEDQKVDDGIWQGAYGDKIHNFEGTRGERVLISASKDAHKIIRTYSGRKWTLIKGDRNNNLHTIKNDDGTIQGIELEYFHVFNLTKPTPEMPSMTPIEYQEADPGEWDDKGFYFNPDFRVKDIMPITLITITAGAVAADAFTLTANFVPWSRAEDDGSAIEKPWEGGVIADIQIIDQTGAVNAATDVTESTTTPGEYSVTGTNPLTSGTVQVTPNADNLFESNIATLSA